MTRTENEYFEISQNGRNNQKDFHAIIPRYLSHKNTSDFHAFHRPLVKATFFVVDWQQSMEGNPDTHIGHL